jgi:acyl-CoA synthetase (AMP-forming)/AMP-acid ligase II
MRPNSVRDEHTETIGAVLDRQAREFGAAVAIAGPEGVLSYRDLQRAAREVSRALMTAGLRRGDRVAIWAPNSARWIVAALGVLGAGGVLVPVGTRLRGAEAADMLARSRSRLLFTVRGFLGQDYPRMLADSGCALPDLIRVVLLSDTLGPDDARPPTSTGWAEFIELRSGTTLDAALARAAEISPDDVSDILFTSGTTGAPKGVLATHRRTLAVFQQWTGAVGLRHDDRYLLVNPFSHTFGYRAGIVACLLRAATMVPVERFDPAQVAELVDRARITVLTGPPTLFHDLVRHGRALPTVRLAGTGGSAIPTTLIEQIRDVLGVEQVFTAYGLTESLGVVTVYPPGTPLDLTATTVGKPLRGTEIRILDPDGSVAHAGTAGEIAVRGPNLMRGYLDDPAATAAAIDRDGWLHTGDVGILGTDGNLRVTDRLADLFIVGGFNAYPAEIERILLGHPAIADVAVIGVPDDRLGEVAEAYVVPVDSAQADAAEILEWARTRLAGYKMPRRIHFLDTLPRTAAGKVRKNFLRSGPPE